MGPPRSRKGIHTAKKKYNRKYVLATKHRARDIDQVRDDLAKRQKIAGSEEKLTQEEEPKVFEIILEKSGADGQWSIQPIRVLQEEQTIDFSH